MSDELLLHPATRRHMDAFVRKPAHALLVLGQGGSGKKTVARYLAASVLGLPSPDALDGYPYHRIIAPAENGSIPIEAIREVQSVLTLRTPGHDNGIRRVILLYEAGRMGTEAQNAFLKTLEEPPADTCIIMTGTIDRPVLPTIRSRARTLDVLPVPLEACLEQYAGRFDAQAIRTAYALSAGQAGLLHALLTDNDHALRVWVDTAKQLLSATQFDRLARVEEFARDKAAAGLLLDALQRIARAALRSAAAQHKTAAVKRWHDTLGLIDRSREALQYNANTKLVLTNVLFNL